MRHLLSLTFWAYLVVSCVVLWVGAVVVWGVTLPFDRRRAVLHAYSSAWAFHYVRLWPSFSLTIEGRERLPAGAAVIAPNHQSLADILVLYGLFHPFKWVSKASIFKVPVIGWNMRMNDYVPLVRGDPSSIAAMMDHCRRHLRNGVAVLMFPEGTRSRDGALRPFKHGAFTLACDEGVPVVPVMVDGTHDLLPKSGFVIQARPIHGRVRVLEPVHPDEVGGDPGLLRDRVRARIQEALDAVRGRDPARGW